MMSFELFEGTAVVVLGWLAQALALGTGLALITWLTLSTALRGARPVVHGVFWLVVLAKFLIPNGPGWSYSLSSLATRVTGPLPAAVAPAPVPSTDVYVEIPGLARTASGVKSPAPAAINATAAAASAPRFSLPVAIVSAYLLGLLIAATWRIAAYRRFARRCEKLPPAGRGARAMVQRICRRSGVRRMPIVRLSDEDGAPFVYGLLRPTLVLSRRQALSRLEVEAVLLHEIAHLRRFDMGIRHLQWLVGTLLYFWPVVAWVNRRIDLARELACDEWALRHGRLSPGQYARCLLNAARNAPPSWAEHRPAAMAANVRVVERRIEMIMDMPARGRARRFVGAGAGVAALAWGTFALSGASAAVKEVKPAEDKVEARAVMLSEDGELHEIDLSSGEAADVLIAADGDGTQTRVFQRFALGDGTGPMVMRTCREFSDEGLAAFADAHPNADADLDGAVTLEEHDAYLTALAMSDADAVIEKFPHADANADGALDANEAAGLITGQSGPALAGKMFNMHLPAPQGGDAAMAFVVGDGEWNTLNPAAGAVAIAAIDDVHFQVSHSGDAGDQEVRIIRSPEAGEGAWVADGEPANVIVRRVPAEDATETSEETREMKFVGPDGASKEIRVERVDGGEPRVWIDGEEVDPADANVEIITGDDVQVHAGDATAELHDHLMGLVGGHMAAAGLDLDAVHGGLMKIMLADPSGPHALAWHGDAGAWVAENVAGDVTRAQVQERLADVRNAPLSAFLKMHPEADYNEDGVLTEAERDRYIDASSSRARQKLLERFPDADADQDGLLTDTELHEFFKSRHGVRMRTRAGAPGAEAEATAGTLTAEADAQPVIKQRRRSPD